MPNSNPNIVKTSHNFFRNEKGFLESLAKENNITETDVLRSALRLLMALSEKGVKREVDISVPVKGSQELREGPTYVLPFNLDLSAIREPGLSTDQ
jgi:hypothetical protein